MAKVLLTGGSSFTGLWIAEALVAAGHEVTAPLTRELSAYDGLRAQRIERLGRIAAIVTEAPVDSLKFQRLIHRGFDLFGHHAADIRGYRSPNYDPVEGLNRNLKGIQLAAEAHARSGGRAVIVTGTVFEAGEGGGEASELAVSPYGLSKYLTNETIRHYTRWCGLKFGKFVITNPFGAFEEGRLCWSLFQRWFDGRPGVVRTPRYVRDNIPAPLLARAYAELARALLQDSAAGEVIARPSGYVGTQQAFATKVAKEVAPRLNLACDIESLEQAEFLEPLVRVNDAPAFFEGWSEEGFWDDYARYYRRIAGEGFLKAPA